MLTVDLGPAFAYGCRRAARHIDGLHVGEALAIDVGDRRVTIERRADGFAVDGETLPSRAAVQAILHQAAAAWLIERKD